MQLKYKPDFDRVKKYMRAYWNKDIIDRPAACVYARKEGNRLEKIQRVVYLQNVKCEDDCRTVMEQFENTAAGVYYGGEAVPFFEATFGPDQVAGFFGAKMHYSSETGTSWVDPCIDDIRNAGEKLEIKRIGEINPGVENIFRYSGEDGIGIYDKYLAFSRYFTKFSEGKFLQSIADLHGNMDCLSAMRSPINLCYDIADYPDEVEKALQKALKTYDKMAGEMFEAADVKNRGSIGWSPIYCEGRCAVIQCDFSCLISPDDARRYVIPSIRKEASSLDFCVYHYDGKGALGHLDDVLSMPEIDVIQWVPGAGQPKTVEWMDLLKKIQAAGKGLWLYDWTEEDIKSHYKELKPTGLLFSLWVKTPGEADSLLEWLRKNT